MSDILAVIQVSQYRRYDSAVQHHGRMYLIALLVLATICYGDPSRT